MGTKMEKQKKTDDSSRTNWNIRPYLAVGLTVLVVIIVAVTYYFAVLRYHGLSNYWKKAGAILQPITFGIILVYLVSPIVRWEEKMLMRTVGSKQLTPKRKKTHRYLSIIGALLFILIILIVLLNLIIPQVYKSIQGLMENLPLQYRNTVYWFEHTVLMNNQWAKYTNQWFGQLSEYLQTWITKDLLPQTKDVLGSLTIGIMSVVRLILNILIGFIVAAYVLMEKEHFVGQAKKIIYAIAKPETGNNIIRRVRKSNEIFGGFVIGKLIDSMIIGLLTFAILTVVSMPYALLVSIIVGVTNVIPFFGPFIGAIPSFFLILLVDPVKALWFLLIIFIIQQLDGNIIGPKILGDSTGLSSFWVMFAILVAGGVFGFMGMLFGVPVFAIIYYLISEWIETRLAKKKLPITTDSYVKLEKIDPKDNGLISTQTNDKTNKSKKSKKNKKSNKDLKDK